MPSTPKRLKGIFPNRPKHGIPPGTFRRGSNPQDSICTHLGHYEYLRQPFGLSNAPQIFQQFIIEKLTKFPFATAFVDDILIFSQDIESHKTHLRQVLQHLQKKEFQSTSKSQRL
jgi:hypothetical protein